MPGVFCVAILWWVLGEQSSAAVFTNPPANRGWERGPEEVKEWKLPLLDVVSITACCNWT